MSGLRTRLLNAGLRLLVKRPVARTPLTVANISRLRLRMQRLNRYRRYPARASFEPDQLAGVPVERVRFGQPSKGAPLLYLHGGGFLVGSATDYRPLTWRLARELGRELFVPDYRLAPEHPFPAALDDVTACYRQLLEQGHAPETLALAGDSAGGNLVLALLHRLGRTRLPMPAAAACYSPWTDLTASGASVRTHRDREAMLPAPALNAAAERYAPARLHTDPEVSPLFGDFADWPPLSLDVGCGEILLDDSRRLAERARSAGVEVRLKLWPGQPHVFPIFADLLPEAAAAIRESCAFIMQATRAVPSTTRQEP